MVGKGIFHIAMQFCCVLRCKSVALEIIQLFLKENAFLKTNLTASIRTDSSSELFLYSTCESLHARLTLQRN